MLIGDFLGDYYIFSYTAPSPLYNFAIGLTLVSPVSYTGTGSELAGSGATDTEKLEAIGTALETAINGLGTDLPTITFHSVSATKYPAFGQIYTA
jgi:hypothetical protein